MKKEINVSILEIGCCGAYCKSCLAGGMKGFCKGCKLGYEDGKRDITKSKCRMKVCCFKEHKLQTCADCKDYASCKIMKDFYGHGGYKYKKYKESMEFIIKNGYPKFIKAAKNWKRAYGNLKK
jgi:hypothetical protein